MCEETIIHSTKVRLDLKGLAVTLEELKQSYLEINHRDSHEGKSRFSKWNNINKLYERLMTGEIPSEVPVESGFAVFTITGSVKGASARVYYKPSITSLAKPIRKHIVPLKEGNVFVYFDLKAAEFFMNCVFCGEQEAIREYQSGNDVYMYYKNMFPANTPRKAIKECLIANMYGMTAYTLSRRLCEAGIETTETQADRMLRTVAERLPSMTANKIRVIGQARRANAYLAPRGFDQRDLIKVSEPTAKSPFNPLLALSTYVQSALGCWMQDIVHRLEPKTSGTIITVFDSVTCEINPDSLERYQAWISTIISPFRADAFQIGKSFYDAQEGISK